MIIPANPNPSRAAMDLLIAINAAQLAGLRHYAEALLIRYHAIFGPPAAPASNPPGNVASPSPGGLFGAR